MASGLKEKLDLYQRIIENSRDIIYSTDAAGNVTYVSPQVSLLGYEEEDIVGHNLLEFVYDEDKERVLEDFQRSMSTGDEFPTVFRLLAKDGSYVYTEDYAKVITGNGEVVGLTGVLRDVTERKKMEDALKESERRFQLFFENNPAYCYMISSGGIILDVNRSVLKELGYSKRELVGKSLLETLYAPSSREKAIALFRNWKNNGTLRGEELTILTKDGKERSVLLSADAVRNSKGELLHSLSVQTDITDYRKLEEQIVHMEKMEAVGRLAAGIAHDFNNLLQEIVLVGHETPGIFRLVRRGSNLVQKMFGYVGKEVADFEVVDLNKIVAYLSDLLDKGTSSTTPYNLDYDFKATNYIYADSGQIQRIVSNLALNARDAMPDGGTIKILTEDVDAISIIVGLYCTIPAGEYVRLSVSDKGTGIKKDDLDKIFEPFYTTKDRTKGTGLGLSGVWTIVEHHGAHVDVNTSEGKGTSFDIYFPAVDPVEVVIDSVAPSAADLEGILEGCKLVLAEDESGILLDLKKHLLKAKKCDVVAAVHNGLKALRALKKNPDVDLIVTDISMPKLDGIELCHEVLEHYPDIYVCLLSGHIEDNKIKDLIGNDRVTFVQKPIDIPSLDRTLGELMLKKIKNKNN
jgi:PAS domain S-box-containing protein